MINFNKYYDVSILKVFFIGFELEKFEKLKRRFNVDFIFYLIRIIILI